MTTLAADALRTMEIGNIEEYPMIASDIIYALAAVGLVDASGHARPLAGGDRFVGFAELRVDNAAGAAAAKTVRVVSAGKVQLSVSGAVITDVCQPVYASDDDTFVFSPVGGSFVGKVDRFVSSGVVIVKFDCNAMVDPYGDYETREALTSTKTFDAEDCGKLFWCTGDGSALTLPAIAAGVSGFKLVAGGAFGSMAMTVSPNASDLILARDLAAVDDKDLLLTKATQRRGDFVELIAGDADGYMATRIRGIWTKEA
jgi:hypothetical protein